MGYNPNAYAAHENKRENASKAQSLACSKHLTNVSCYHYAPISLFSQHGSSTA